MNTIKRRWSLIISLILFLLLSVWVFSEFLASIILGGFLTFIFMPVQNKLTWIKNKEHRAAIITFGAIFVILLLCFLLIQVFVLRIDTSIDTINKFAEGELTDCQGDFLCDVVVKFGNLRDTEIAQQFFQDIFNPTTQAGRGVMSNTVSTVSKLILLLPEFILFLFLTFLSMWYFLAHNEKIYRGLCKISPLKTRETDLLFASFHNLLKGFVYGFLLTAVAQAIVSGVIYYYSGFNNPVVLGLLTGLFGSIPVIGTGIIWLPLLIYKVLTGMSMEIPFMADSIILLIGGILVSSIDNIIKPKVMANLVLMDVYYLILGVLGGAALFGVSGLIIGPFIIVITHNLIKIYIKTRGSKR